MKENNLDQNDSALSALLRESRLTPALPPRFQENVWQRIERAETKAKTNWLDALAGWLVRPRLAFAVAAVLVLVGVGVGWNKGEQLARNGAQARYLSAVAPNALH